jgi:hypothetical protein
MAITTIEVEDMITVGALADKLALPVAKIITEMMKNGILATVNEKIDLLMKKLDLLMKNLIC